jgi:hypothetical protein
MTDLRRLMSISFGCYIRRTTHHLPRQPQSRRPDFQGLPLAIYDALTGTLVTSCLSTMSTNTLGTSDDWSRQYISYEVIPAYSITGRRDRQCVDHNGDREGQKRSKSECLHDS